jgi:hypothetical protein
MRGCDGFSVYPVEVVALDPMPVENLQFATTGDGAYFRNMLSVREGCEEPVQPRAGGPCRIQ